MNRFSYARPVTLGAALDAVAAGRVIAGGTNLVDLMKYNVEKPAGLIDINALPLGSIEETEGGGLRIGALGSIAAVAADARVRERYPLLASAIFFNATFKPIIKMLFNRFIRHVSPYAFIICCMTQSFIMVSL